MNTAPHLMRRWPAVLAAAIVFFVAGAGATYLVLEVRRAPHDPVPGPATGRARIPSLSGGNTGSAPGGTFEPASGAVITLTEEAVRQTGITLATATPGTEGAGLRLPAVVEANAYNQVTVTPLVAGRISRVLVELGQAVRRGQALAEVFSPELAEAETRYIAMRAELDAHERELQRTSKLATIGAASQQELERLHAEHAGKLTAVESARSRLELLGLSAEAIGDLGPGRPVPAVVAIPSPMAGIVTERAANAGLNVDSASKVFVVVDLSTVWIVGDVYEKDLSRVSVGNPAHVTTRAFPDSEIQGRVSYIDPQLNPETRTAKIRVEVPNPQGRLRLGMFADMIVDGKGDGPVRIPRTAVQTVGDRTVVYVADPRTPGRYTVRDVRLGQATGTDVAVLAGVQEGESVVATGSFFVRAERDRLGLGSTEPAARSTPGPALDPQATVHEAKITVTERGFEPERVTVDARAPAKLTVVRTTDKTCATEIVFPTLNIRRALPLNQPIVIEFTPKAAGEIRFVCGMNMLGGTVVAR